MGWDFIPSHHGQCCLWAKLACCNTVMTVIATWLFSLLLHFRLALLEGTRAMFKMQSQIMSLLYSQPSRGSWWLSELATLFRDLHDSLQSTLPTPLFCFTVPQTWRLFILLFMVFTYSFLCLDAPLWHICLACFCNSFLFFYFFCASIILTGRLMEEFFTQMPPLQNGFAWHPGIKQLHSSPLHVIICSLILFSGIALILPWQTVCLSLTSR